MNDPRNDSAERIGANIGAQLRERNIDPDAIFAGLSPADFVCTSTRSDLLMLLDAHNIPVNVVVPVEPFETPPSGEWELNARTRAVLHEIHEILDDVCVRRDVRESPDRSDLRRKYAKMTDDLRKDSF